MELTSSALSSISVESISSFNRLNFLVPGIGIIQGFPQASMLMKFARSDVQNLFGCQKKAGQRLSFNTHIERGCKLEIKKDA